jgi:amino acid transporter
VFLFSLSLLLGYLNYRGLTVVGHTILTAVIVILVPFLILTALCVPYVNTANWIKVRWPPCVRRLLLDGRHRNVL